MLLSDNKVSSEVIIDVERDDTRITLTSKVQDQIQHGVSVYAPVVNGSLFSFHSKDQVFVRALINGKLLRWKCFSWKVRNKKGIWVLELLAKDKGASYNRREAFRVPLGVDVSFKGDEVGVVSVTLRDISAIGVGFDTTKELPLGEILAFNLTDDYGDIPVVIKVVRHEPPTENEKMHKYGAVIVNNDNSPRLTQFVSKKQIEYIRRIRSAEG